MSTSSSAPTSDPASSPAAPAQPTAAETLAAAKKKADEAQQVINKKVQEKLSRSKTTDARSGRKKKDENIDPSADTDEDGTYRVYGRNLARTMGPFIRVLPIVEFGVRHTLSQDDSDEEAPAPTDINELRMFESWKILKATIPKFAEDMIELGGNRKLRKAVSMEIQTGLKGARSDDTSTLKKDIPEYLLPPVPRAPEGQPQPKAAVLDPPIPPNGSKACRGFNHPVTAKLLCPIGLPATAEAARLRSRAHNCLSSCTQRTSIPRISTRGCCRATPCARPARPSIKAPVLRFNQTGLVAARLGMQHSMESCH
ncbi:hypothetical protein C8J57DRAFT_550447 [Mycena rebaudengoi]|nr:hypothetical protein C8J57DRAFT_550447 [Mycena rebaudengoi]